MCVKVGGLAGTLRLWTAGSTSFMSEAQKIEVTSKESWQRRCSVRGQENGGYWFGPVGTPACMCWLRSVALSCSTKETHCWKTEDQLDKEGSHTLAVFQACVRQIDVSRWCQIKMSKWEDDASGNESHVASQNDLKRFKWEEAERWPGTVAADVELIIFSG